jgi:hypothetical protein
MQHGNVHACHNTVCCRTRQLQACLSSISQQRHHWSEQPCVAFHGHALAAGEGRWLHACTAVAANLPLTHVCTVHSNGSFFSTTRVCTAAAASFKLQAANFGYQHEHLVSILWHQAELIQHAQVYSFQLHPGCSLRLIFIRDHK